MSRKNNKYGKPIVHSIPIPAVVSGDFVRVASLSKSGKENPAVRSDDDLVLLLRKPNN